MEPAPFHGPLPPGAPEPRAVFVRAEDGVRLRIVHYPPPPGGRGTLLVFPGRSEWAEKYALPAAEFAARGWGLLLPDWRGQALSDRLHRDPRVGHVERFLDYQTDVAALLATARALGLGAPGGLVAHSMGGAIALRALARGLAVPAVVFTAPMLGIAPGAYLRPALRMAGSALRRGLASRDAGQGPDMRGTSYIASEPFEHNAITSDPEVFAAVQAQARGRPELALGAPTLHWLAEALRELRALRTLPAPRLPMLTVLGTEEAVVDARAVRAHVARWPGGRLLLLPGGRHEPLLEAPHLRAAVYDAAAGLFDRAGR